MSPAIAIIESHIYNYGIWLPGETQLSSGKGRLIEGIPLRGSIVATESMLFLNNVTLDGSLESLGSASLGLSPNTALQLRGEKLGARLKVEQTGAGMNALNGSPTGGVILSRQGAVSTGKKDVRIYAPVVTIASGTELTPAASFTNMYLVGDLNLEGQLQQHDLFWTVYLSGSIFLNANAALNAEEVFFTGDVTIQTLSGGGQSPWQASHSYIRWNTEPVPETLSN